MDEPVTETPVAPVEEATPAAPTAKPVEKTDAEWLASNPAFAERLAQIVSEESLRLFQGDVRTQLANARHASTNGALALAALQPSAAPSVFVSPQRQKLAPEQVGEWFRCVCARGVGMHAVPQKAYDVDGCISRMLNPMAGLITQATTAIAPATASTGGYLVPEDWQADIIKRAEEPSVVWPLITKRGTRREAVVKPEVSAYPSTNEGANAKSKSSTVTDNITVTSPTFTERTWTMRYFDARCPIKLDQLDDSPMNVVDEITALVADAFSVSRETNVISGTGPGNSLPSGIQNAVSGITTVAIDAAVTLALLLNFWQEVPQRYRMSSSKAILMSSQTLFALAAELATNVRSAQFVIDKLPPMYESAKVMEGKLLGGDFSRYVVYHNLLMRVVTAVVPANFSLDIVFVEKWDGQVTIPDAFRIATGVTYT